ncbi:MAG TPA: type IV pilus twitching motility protein PilT [Symbiobacteriaceae bacterium]|nr:type IV pilus twitching motility protein PilT [Symbiobacteriaceae bacterium]
MLLRDAVSQGASDVHLCESQPPIFRIHGQMLRQSQLPLAVDELNDAIAQVVPPAKHAEFQHKGEVDCSYAVSGLGRFRVNAYRQRNSPALALRAIPFRIAGLGELGLPEVISSFCDKPYGLVIVTGPTGHGKSTTLAALIDLINERRSCHIITLEDPIEFVHRDKQAVINQREIGADTLGFSDGLRAALRQDPDVILLGEMRDLETIRIALQAAETGHLVFTTLHTNDAAGAIDRIVDVFPADQQEQVRVQLGATLQGVVAQRLFQRKDQPGRVVATEILVATPAVRNLVREGKSHQILSTIQTGGKLGMRTMVAAVRELHEKGLIQTEDYQIFVGEPISSTAAGRQ